VVGGLVLESIHLGNMHYVCAGQKISDEAHTYASGVLPSMSAMVSICSSVRRLATSIAPRFSSS